MTIRKKIKIETFSSNLTLIISDDIKKEIARIYKKYKSTPSEMEVEGIFITTSDGYHLIIDLSCLSHNTIAHEIYHAVVRVTEDRDIVDEETQAWLCGYITESMYKFLKDKKIEIK